MFVCKKIIIHRHVSNVYRNYHELSLWPRILDDIINVDIFFQDENYQKFSMTVSRPNGVETVSGYRFCVSNEKIELYQNVPPPGFKSMRGTWLFLASGEDSTQVQATRDFESLNKSQTESVKSKIDFYLEKNLLAFKEYIENGAN